MILAETLGLIAQVEAAPDMGPTWPMVVLALIAALTSSGLLGAVTAWVKAKAQRDALVAGIEDSGSREAKLAAQKRTREIGLEITKTEVERLTRKLPKVEE